MWRKNRRPSAKLLLRSARQFWPNQPFPGFGGFGGSGTGGSNGLAGYPGSNPGSKCWGTDPNRNFDINHGTAGRFLSRIHVNSRSYITLREFTKLSHVT